MDKPVELDDPLNKHFSHDLSPNLLAALSSKKYEVSKHTWATLKQLIVKLPKCDVYNEHPRVLIQENMSYVNVPGPPVKVASLDLSRFHVKSQIARNVLTSNLVHVGESNLSDLQLELFSIVHEYRDMYFTERNFSNSDELRLVYCLHVINHALKVHLKVLRHNGKISDESNIPDELRDQGIVRPKVLVLVPFKSSAFSIIKMICSLFLGEEKQNVFNKKRFYDEFDGDDISPSQKRSRPEDYKKIFAGNIDDNFKIGIAISKKSLKLYADFYSSDIIVASPLGLRMIVGAEGEADRDFDFLASIEVLVVDQADVLLMQNWDHVLHIMDHLNLQPRDSHGANFLRVRSWDINGWSKYYRQNLILSAYPLVQVSAMVSQISCNYAGCVRTNNPTTIGTISQVVVSIPQIFYKLSEKSAEKTVDERFNTFVQRVLPQCQDNLMKHVLIYIPSYFDFVRLRNYFKNEAISYTQICEYSKDRKVAEARDHFFHHEVNYMLYSERFHFFRRRRIRGIRHLVFYQLPTFPHFYSEMCNLMQDANQNSKFSENMSTTISVIYSKYDAPQLSAIVSTDRAVRMLCSDKDIHMFMTDGT